MIRPGARTLSLGALALACSCSGPDLPTVPEGRWGGDHISLEVEPGGSRVELDCARGTIAGPLALDSRGRFEAQGVFVREHAGPVRPDEPADAHPALYAGSTDGRTMRLTITVLDAAAPPASFQLGLGRTARVVKCL